MVRQRAAAGSETERKVCKTPILTMSTSIAMLEKLGLSEILIVLRSSPLTLLAGVRFLRIVMGSLMLEAYEVKGSSSASSSLGVSSRWYSSSQASSG